MDVRSQFLTKISKACRYGQLQRGNSRSERLLQSGNLSIYLLIQRVKTFDHHSNIGSNFFEQHFESRTF